MYIALESNMLFLLMKVLLCLVLMKRCSERDSILRYGFQTNHLGNRFFTQRCVFARNTHTNGDQS